MHETHFHSELSENNHLRYIYPNDMFAIGRENLQSHVGNNVTLFRSYVWIQKCKISRIVARRNHGKCGQSEKNEGYIAFRRMQYPFKGNLLSARLQRMRMRRNSCKSRIDTGQLLVGEGKWSTGVRYTQGVSQTYDTIILSAEAKITEKC